MALSSAVLTARRALALIGSQSNIESFNEDRPEAALSSLFFDQSREEILSEHDWAFARRFRALPESTKDPVNGWKYRYTLPSDMLALRGQVSPQGRKAKSPPGQMETVGEIRTFMTDVEGLTIWYTATVPSSLDPTHFNRAHTFLLASYLSDAYLADLDRSQLWAGRYREEALPMAKAVDAREETPDDPQEASWIRNR